VKRLGRPWPIAPPPLEDTLRRYGGEQFLWEAKFYPRFLSSECRCIQVGGGQVVPAPDGDMIACEAHCPSQGWLLLVCFGRKGPDLEVTEGPGTMNEAHDMIACCVRIFGLFFVNPKRRDFASQRIWAMNLWTVESAAGI